MWPLVEVTCKTFVNFNIYLDFILLWILFNSQIYTENTYHNISDFCVHILDSRYLIMKNSCVLSLLLQKFARPLICRLDSDARCCCLGDRVFQKLILISQLTPHVNCHVAKIAFGHGKIIPRNKVSVFLYLSLCWPAAYFPPFPLLYHHLWFLENKNSLSFIL